VNPPWNRESTAALQQGLRQAACGITELWVASVGIGGHLNRRDVQQITDGDRAATRAEHDVLACALNDRLSGQGKNHPIALWRDLPAT
jgi:hypothetical protein